MCTYTSSSRDLQNKIKVHFYRRRNEYFEQNVDNFYKKKRSDVYSCIKNCTAYSNRQLLFLRQIFMKMKSKSVKQKQFDGLSKKIYQ